MSAVHQDFRDLASVSCTALRNRWHFRVPPVLIRVASCWWDDNRNVYDDAVRSYVKMVAPVELRVNQ